MRMISRWRGAMMIGKFQFVLWATWQWGWQEMPRAFRVVYADHVLWLGPLEIRRFR